MKRKIKIPKKYRFRHITNTFETIKFSFNVGYSRITLMQRLTTVVNGKVHDLLCPICFSKQIDWSFTPNFPPTVICFKRHLSDPSDLLIGDETQAKAKKRHSIKNKKR